MPCPVTTISTPEEYAQPLIEQSPMNQSFSLGLIIDNFTKSEQCTAEFVASVPRPKLVAWKNFSLRRSPRSTTQLRAWKKIAKQLTARGSLGALATAALWWHYFSPESRGEKAA